MKLKTILIVKVRVGSVEDETEKVWQVYSKRIHLRKNQHTNTI